MDSGVEMLMECNNAIALFAMTKQLPQVGFSLYPEEKTQQPAVSTFASEGKLAFPHVVASESPFKAAPVPSKSLSSQDAAKLDEASRTNLFSGGAKNTSTFGFSNAADSSSVLEKKVETMEKSIARLLGVETKCSAIDGLEDRVHALENKFVQLYDSIGELAKRMDIMENTLQTPFLPFDENNDDEDDKPVLDDAILTDIFKQNASDVILYTPPGSDDDGGFEETKDGDVVEEEDAGQEERVSEIRVISFSSKAALVKDLEKIAEIKADLATKSEKEVSKLRVQDITDMLQAFGEQYVPPKIEAVRLLMKLSRQE